MSWRVQILSLRVRPGVSPWHCFGVVPKTKQNKKIEVVFEKKGTTFGCETNLVTQKDEKKSKKYLVNLRRKRKYIAKMQV